LPDNLSSKFLHQLLPPYKEIDLNQVEDSLILLKTYSLIQLDDGLASIHRLIQVVTKLSFHWKIKLNFILKNYNKWEEIDGTDVEHLQSLWNHAVEDEELVKNNSSFLVTLAGTMCNFWYDNRMTSFAQENVKLLTNLCGPNHKNTIGIEFWLASGLDNEGKYQDALLQFESVYHKRKKLYGPDHPSTL